MGYESKRDLIDSLSVDKDSATKFVTGAGSTTYLTVFEQFVQATGAAAAQTIVLPPVAEARGKIYTIFNVSGTFDITVTDKGDDAGFGDLVLGDSSDYLVLYSDGARWYLLVGAHD